MARKNTVIETRGPRSFGPALTALFEDVIDPVQSENTHDDQIDLQSSRSEARSTETLPRPG